MDQPNVAVGTEDGVYFIGNRQIWPGHSISHLAITADGFWAILDGRALGHGPTEGEGRRIAGFGDRAHCLLPLSDRMLVGASGASLVEYRDGEVQRVGSFDHAPGRSDWYTPWGGPPDVRSIAAGPDGTIYVNVHVGGVVRSTDDGTSWTDTMDIHADVHQVVADQARPERAYAASARGLAVTADGADTWQFEDDGLDSPYCRAVALSREHVFVTASGGPQGTRAGLYRMSPDGGSFRRCTEGLPEWFSTNLDTFCLAARDTFVVAGDAAGTVYASRDDGDTWGALAEGLPPIRCLAII